MYLARPFWLFASLLLALPANAAIQPIHTTKTITDTTTVTTTSTSTSTSLVKKTSTSVIQKTTTSSTTITKTATTSSTTIVPVTSSTTITHIATVIHTSTQVTYVNQTSTLLATLTQTTTSTLAQSVCPTQSGGSTPPGGGGGGASSSSATSGSCPGGYYTTPNGRQFEIYCGYTYGGAEFEQFRNYTDTLEKCVDICSGIRRCNGIRYTENVKKSSGNNNCIPLLLTANTFGPKDGTDTAVLMSTGPGSSSSYSNSGGGSYSSSSGSSSTANNIQTQYGLVNANKTIGCSRKSGHTIYAFNGQSFTVSCQDIGNCQPGHTGYGVYEGTAYQSIRENSAEACAAHCTPAAYFGEGCLVASWVPGVVGDAHNCFFRETAMDCSFTTPDFEVWTMLNKNGKGTPGYGG